MKKNFFAALMAFGLLAASNGATAQVEQGSIIIDPYYGFPNFGKNIVNALIPDSSFDVAATGIGPAGLRFEYLLADNLGIGVDFIYNSSGIKGSYNSTDTAGVTRIYTDELKMQRIRVMLRINYHFVQTDELDAYVGGGAGYNTRIWSNKSDNPDYIEDESISGALLPVSARIALGMRYYFHPNIGINAELGLGGPVISAGLSLKFN